MALSSPDNGQFEPVADFLFLEDVYREEGVDLAHIRHDIRIRNLALCNTVAGVIMDMLITGQEDFPILEVPDPTGSITIPTKLELQAFRKVTNKDLQKLPHPAPITSKFHEADLNVLSPYRDSSLIHRSLGGLSISTSQGFSSIESIRLSRGHKVSHDLNSEVMRHYVDPTALALVDHVNSYLNQLGR